MFLSQILIRKFQIRWDHFIHWTYMYIQFKMPSTSVFVHVQKIQWFLSFVFISE